MLTIEPDYVYNRPQVMPLPLQQNEPWTPDPESMFSGIPLDPATARRSVNSAAVKKVTEHAAEKERQMNMEKEQMNMNFQAILTAQQKVINDL